MGFNPTRICCRQLHRQWFTIVGGIDFQQERNGGFGPFRRIGYWLVPPAKQLCSMAVLIMPGLNGTVARPGGNSCASADVSPSITHFAAASASVERPPSRERVSSSRVPAFAIRQLLCE